MFTYKCNPSCGYFALGEKKVTVDFRLDRQPFAQAGVDYIHFVDDGFAYYEGYRLVSYITAVLFLTDDKILHVSDTYSRTTIKHIISFLREYCPQISYQMVKEACAKHMAIDCNICELIPEPLDYDNWSHVNYKSDWED